MFQEIAIAHNHVFLCGNQMIRGDVLEAGILIFAMAVLGKIFDLVQQKSDIKEIVEMGMEAQDYVNIAPSSIWYRAGSRSNHRRSLFEIAGEFIRTNAGFKDPRDRIFATWGFLNPEDYDFQPDYSSSTKDVFVNASKAIIDAAGHSVLSLCYDHEANAIPNLPSWCPDWSLPQQKNRFIDPNYTFRRQSEHSFETDINGDIVLRVQGLHLDTIVYVTDVYNGGPTVTMKDFATGTEDGLEEGSIASIFGPHLPLWRGFASLIRKLYLDLANQWPPNKVDTLTSVLLRCLNDEGLGDDKLDVFRCLISRNPIEATILLCLSSKAPSSESCDTCTQGLHFPTRLEALFCVHLPVLYNSPVSDSFDDLFVPSNFQTTIIDNTIGGQYLPLFNSLYIN
jgi:hypothetical protein